MQLAAVIMAKTLTEASQKCLRLKCAGRVADRCVQIHGGAGYISEYAIERFIAMCVCSVYMKEPRKFNKLLLLKHD